MCLYHKRYHKVFPEEGEKEVGEGQRWGVERIKRLEVLKSNVFRFLASIINLAKMRALTCEYSSCFFCFLIFKSYSMIIFNFPDL